MPGPLQIDISPIATRHVLDLLHRVLLANVDDHISAAILGDVQLVLSHVQCNNRLRVLRFRTGDHAKTDGPAARYHNSVLKLDVAALHGMQRTGERLSEGSVCGWQIGRDLVNESVLVIDHVLGHATRRTALEAEDVMGSAHPILPVQAVATLPTRHNLLSYDAVANRDVPAVSRHVIELNNFSDELMAGNDFGLGPRWTVRVPPELRCTVIALQIAGADAGRLDLDQRLTRSRLRDGYLFHLVVLRPMANNGLHCLGNLSDLIGRGIGHVNLPAQ